MSTQPVRSSRTSPSVSVIIPVRRINDYIRESVPLLVAYPYPYLEVLVLPDARDLEPCSIDTFDKVRVVATGPIGPAAKRDIGARIANGDILAFLDDDAFPDESWLGSALPHFRDADTAAVGGPTSTPPNDSFLRQASGWVMASRLGSGGAQMRYAPKGTARDVDDWPSVNLLVRKADFLAVGGFDCEFYPGEDTKLCLDLTKRLGKRIVYEPAAIVYHHRRPLFWDHFRQIGQYAVHRGYFAKVFPETSRRVSYFLPSALAVGLIGGIPLALSSRPLRSLYLAAVLSYTAALATTAVSVGVRSKRPALGMASALGVGMTHVWYGISFLRGLLARDLAR